MRGGIVHIIRIVEEKKNNDTIGCSIKSEKELFLTRVSVSEYSKMSILFTSNSSFMVLFLYLIIQQVFKH